MSDVVILKEIVDENFQDYKKTSMFLAFPKCDFKCFKELGLPISMCQNFKTLEMTNFMVKIEDIFERYVKNPISEAIVLGGLEPFFSFGEIINLIGYFRAHGCDDDFVIYTGYRKDEVLDKIEQLKKFKNIIIKFGRYIPNSRKKFDETLGVYLPSENQYAEKIF